jgi:hypothetical protein
MEVNRMNHKPVEMDPRAIWQNQTTEGVTISVDEVQLRGHRFLWKMRRGMIVFWAALGLHLCGHVARRFVGQEEFMGWAGLFDFATLVIVILYWPYQYVARSPWPVSILPHVASLPGLDFYRRQLELERDLVNEAYAGFGFRGVSGLVFIGVVLALHAFRYPNVMLPFGIPFVILGAMLYVRRKRQRPMIDRELEELKSYYRANTGG